jgi:hypothetical protein
MALKLKQGEISMNKYSNKSLNAMRFCSIVFLTLLVAALAQARTSATAPTAAHDDDDSITPPNVPAELRVEAGNEVFLVGHGDGTQNYVCVPCDTSKPGCPFGVAYSLFTPQATLFDDEGEQLTTHFFSPNPFEANTDLTVVGDHMIRVTWQHSRDTSTVWAKIIGSKAVTLGAIPWLLLQVKDVGAQAGPTGGDKLTKTTFIQRVNTFEGTAPQTGCSSPATDIGNKAFVHYKADYIFYKKAGRHGRDDN